MSEEQQQRFRLALLWKAEQSSKLSIYPKGEIVRLLGYYAEQSLAERLALLEEYDNRQEPVISTQTSPISLSALIKRLLRK